MHDRGLLHGDVKPANVGFTGRNESKLFDLGLSRMTQREMFVHPSMRVGGTPAYLSPEVIDGAPPSTASDLWSLAVLLLEAVIGRHPFAGATPAATRWQILTADSLALCRPIERFDPELAAILGRALGPPETRFQTAQAIRSALERARRRRVPEDHRE
jgi:serine/threonine protein kinase